MLKKNYFKKIINIYLNNHWLINFLISSFIAFIVWISLKNHSSNKIILSDKKLYLCNNKDINFLRDKIKCNNIDKETFLCEIFKFK